MKEKKQPSEKPIMKGVVLEKLPPLKRESFSYSSPSAFRLQEDKGGKEAARNDWQQDIFSHKNWPASVQRKHKSATARQKIYPEEQQNISFGRPEMGTIVPQRSTFNQSNCQADSDYFILKDKKSLDCLKEHWENDKQTNKRRQEKHDGKSILEHLSRERGETNSKSLNGYQILHQDQHRLYENEIWMTKEIQKKKTLLQEKLLKAAESLRKIQLGTASEDKVKSEERRNKGKAESRLYSIEKGNWEWESGRDRSLVLAGRRHEGQREGLNNQASREYGIERHRNHVKETKAGQKEKRRTGTELENRGRNTERTTRTVEKEWDHFEETTRHTGERSRTEKDKTKRERAMEWQKNEIREWDRRDWQGKEIVSRNDGEKRCEQAKLKADTDDEDQQWDIMDKFTSKGKAVSKYHRTNILKEDYLSTQERVHQHNNMAAEDMPLNKVFPAACPSTLDDKRLEQVQLGPENSTDTDVQLVPCKVCNRHFAEYRLEKHISICLKTHKPKRKVYNSSQHRAKGTDLEKFVKTSGRSKSPEPIKNNWRQKHQDIIRNIRQTSAPGADLNPDYVTCPYCSRRFAPYPAERHIPKCQYIKNKPTPPRQHH